MPKIFMGLQGTKSPKHLELVGDLYFVEEINLLLPARKDLENLWIKLKQRISQSSVTVDFCMSGTGYFPVPH